MRRKASAREYTSLHTLVLKSLVISNVIIPTQTTFAMIKQPTIARFCHLTSKTHTGTRNDILCYKGPSPAI
jgi:hypothetical protein